MYITTLKKSAHQSKKIVLLCFFIFQLFYTITAQVPTAGLVGYYPFNGDTNDESSSLTHGINYGATLTNNRFGQVNSAYQFNGIDQYIEMPDSDQFSIADTNRLTISVWMRSDVLDFPNDENNYIHWMGKGVSSQQEWHLRMYNLDDVQRPNRTSCYVFNLSGGLGSGSYVQESVAIGEWIHIVAVYDFPTNTIKLHKNGILKDTDFFTDYNITPQNGTAPLRIGTRDFASFYQGAIDDVRFYNRVLTAAEISELYSEEEPVLSLNNPISIKSASVLAYPNPTNKTLTIKHNVEINQIEIINSTGNIMHSENLNSIANGTHSIDVSNLSSGLYFINTQTSKGIAISKFIKK